jgi:hypothetical protein
VGNHGERKEDEIEFSERRFWGSKVMAGNQPDFNAHAMFADGTNKGRIGAAWKNEDGTVSVKLDPWVSLDASRGISIRLFINEQKSGVGGTRRREPEPKFEEFAGESPDQIVIPDDIPF